MRHVERLHLDLGQATLAASGEKPGSVPVEINCRGPFRFDAVARGHLPRPRGRDEAQSGRSRRSTDLRPAFDLLRPAAAAETPSRAERRIPRRAATFDLDCATIEARGNPVVAQITSLKDADGIVRSSRHRTLEYDLLANSVEARRRPRGRVFKQGPNEIHARSLHYQSAGPGRLGQVTAQGPGRLRGQSPDRPDQQLEVDWKDTLLIHPREQLSGDRASRATAKLTFPGVGTTASPRDILLAGGNADGQPEVTNPVCSPSRCGPQRRPHRLAATCGIVWDQLEVWFKEGATNLAQACRGEPRQSGGYGTNFNAPAVERTAAIAPAPQQTSAQARGNSTSKARHSARQVVLDDPPTVSNLHFDGDVHFDGDGMSLVGPNVESTAKRTSCGLSARARCSFRRPTFFRAQRQIAAGVLRSHWRNRMDFDGRKATLRRRGPPPTTDGQKSLETATDGRHVRPADPTHRRQPRPSSAGRENPVQEPRAHHQPLVGPAAATRLVRPRASERPGDHGRPRRGGDQRRRRLAQQRQLSIGRHVRQSVRLTGQNARQRGQAARQALSAST